MSRRLHASLWLVLVGASAGVYGCVIEANPPVEDDAQQPEAPPEIPVYGSPIQIVDAYPPHGAEDVPIDTPVWMELDRYIDPDLLIRRSTLRMQTGGRFTAVAVQWEMVDKRIVGQVLTPLVPDVQYTWSVDTSRVVGVDGSPMLDAPTIAFRTGRDTLDGTATAPEPSFADDVAPVLDRACGCHRMAEYPDAWFDVAALTYGRIVGQPGRTRDDLLIVEPYRPGASTLMHKALPDYPDRVGTAMPPRWGASVPRTAQVPQRPLTAPELRLIEDWILVGAPP